MKNLPVSFTFRPTDERHYEAAPFWADSEHSSSRRVVLYLQIVSPRRGAPAWEEDNSPPVPLRSHLTTPRGICQGSGLCSTGSSALRQAVLGHLAAGQGPQGQTDMDFPDRRCWRQLAHPGSSLPSSTRRPGSCWRCHRTPVVEMVHENRRVGWGEGREGGSHLQQKNGQQVGTKPFTSTAKAQTTRPQPGAAAPAWQDPNWLRSFHPFRLLGVCTHQAPTKKLDQTKALEGIRSSALVACLEQPERREWGSLSFSRDVRTISERCSGHSLQGKRPTPPAPQPAPNTRLRTTRLAASQEVQLQPPGDQQGRER